MSPRSQVVLGLLLATQAAGFGYGPSRTSSTLPCPVASSAGHSKGPHQSHRRTAVSHRYDRKAATRLHASDGHSVLDDEGLHQALKARCDEINTVNRDIDLRWRRAACESSIGLALDDYIRRLDLSWPLVCVGTAKGSLMVADLRTQRVHATTLEAHPTHVADNGDDLELLHGSFDGGGVTALAFNGETVVSGGRDCCAKVWRVPSRQDSKEVRRAIDRQEARLELVSTLPTRGVVSSATVLEDGHVWTGSLDGCVRCWTPGSSSPFPSSSGLSASDSDSCEGQNTNTPHTTSGSIKQESGATADPPHHPQATDVAKPPRARSSSTQRASAHDDKYGMCSLRVDLGSPVLCLTRDDEREIVFVGTANGKVHALSVHSGQLMASWHPFKTARCRSVTVAQGCLVVGSSDGRLKRRYLTDAEACVGASRATPGTPVPGLNQESDASLFSRIRTTPGGASSAAAAQPQTQARPVFDDAKGHEEFFPSHDGQVVSLAQRCNMLISGAQDGTLRVWDLSAAAHGGPQCLYGFGGYKVWLGSIATDGKRLVSDGSDNLVLMHDFTKDGAGL